MFAVVSQITKRRQTFLFSILVRFSPIQMQFGERNISNTVLYSKRLILFQILVVKKCVGGLLLLAPSLLPSNM